MLRLDDNKYFSKSFTYGIWFLMSFQAGYVNVGGFFTSGNFVSHVTGTSSRIGMGIASLDVIVLMTFITVLLAFIAGATFAGHFIGRPKEENRDPRYTLVLLVKCLFFGLVLVLSTLAENQFQGLTHERINLLIIFFLSFCCGVQNATCALATNGFLKPTHMTGLSTDVGIFMTKMFGQDQSDEAKEARKAHLLRIGILFSFIFGGTVSAMIFNYNGHYGFLFPFISSVSFLFLGLVRNAKKGELNSWELTTAKSTVVGTFLITLYFGVNAYLNISV